MSGMCFVVGVFMCVSLGFAQPNPVLIAQGNTEWAQGRKTVRSSRGWLYAVYYDSLGRVFCARSTDNGLIWPQKDMLNFIGQSVSGYRPSIAVDQGDTLWVVWAQTYFDTLGNWHSDVFWSKYNDSSWTSAANLSNQGNGGSTPSITVDPSNHPHVVWDFPGSPYKVYYSRHDGMAWTIPELVSDGGSMSPSLSSDSSGDLCLAYYVGNVSYRKRVGGVWDAPTVIGNGGGGCITVDYLARPHVVWSASPAEIFYSFFNGTSWSPPLNLSNNIGSSESPSISCDFRNNLYVAWHDNSPDTTKFERVFYRTFDGSSWSPISVISTDTIWPCQFPNIGYPVTDSGVDVIWRQWYNNQWSVMYRRLPLVGCGVERVKPVEARLSEAKLMFQSPVRRMLRGSYDLPSQGKVSLALYDLSGRRVMILDEGERPGGRYDFKCPLALPAGVYFLRLEAGRAGLTRKVVLIR